MKLIQRVLINKNRWRFVYYYNDKQRIRQVFVDIFSTHNATEEEASRAAFDIAQKRMKKDLTTATKGAIL